jgi:hypothetical protein
MRNAGETGNPGSNGMNFLPPTKNNKRAGKWFLRRAPLCRYLILSHHHFLSQ